VFGLVAEKFWRLLREIPLLFWFAVAMDRAPRYTEGWHKNIRRGGGWLVYGDLV
jgi:hypothetical protein